MLDFDHGNLHRARHASLLPTLSWCICGVWVYLWWPAIRHNVLWQVFGGFDHVLVAIWSWIAWYHFVINFCVSYSHDLRVDRPFEIRRYIVYRGNSRAPRRWKPSGKAFSLLMNHRQLRETLVKSPFRRIFLPFLYPNLYIYNFVSRLKIIVVSTMVKMKNSTYFNRMCRL